MQMMERATINYICHYCTEEVPKVEMDAFTRDPYWPSGSRPDNMKINPMECRVNNRRCSKCCAHEQCGYAREDYQRREGLANDAG